MVVIFVIAGICVCTVHLVLGFWLGQKRTPSTEQDSLTAIDEFAAQIQGRVSETIELAKQAQILSNQCSQSEFPLPTHILSQATSVAENSSALQKGMEDMSRLLKGDDPLESSLQSSTTLSHLVMTVTPDETPMAKYRYDVQQSVAPMIEGILPTADQFELVQCRDLSQDGFSFFINHLPESDLIVAALGSPPKLRFYSAKVVASPSCMRNGKPGYQVECRFVGKLSQAYEWDDKLEKIVLMAGTRFQFSSPHSLS